MEHPTGFGTSMELRRILDSATGVALIATNLEGLITGFSHGAELMLGYPAGEVLGQSVLQFHEAREVAARAERLQKELGRKVSGFQTFIARLGQVPSEECEWVYVRKNGQRLTVNLTVTALRTPDGAPAGYLGTAIDISARKEVEAALERERTFFEQVINGLPGVFYLYGADLRLKRWNRNHETLLGYTPDELRDFYVGDWHPTKETSDMAVNATRGILERGVQLDAIESALLHKNGTYVPFLLTGVRIDSIEGPMMAGIGIDLTERRKLEEQLRQAQKMESIGRLAGGVAHDFNNILTAILGNLELVRGALGPTPGVATYLDNLARAAESAAMLTKQLLAFSRKEVISPKVLDMNQVLAGMEGMLGRLLGEDICLSIKGSPGLWTTLIDPGQLDQIILNLTVNARDAMPDGGRLVLETANVTLGEDYAERHPGAVPGEYAMLSVSDTGTGMGPEVMGRLFEPFFTTKEMGRGTGLGLASIFGALKQNKGLIDVYSEPGIGTTFKIYLPRVIGEAVGIHRARSIHPARGGSETVLLAEDDGGIRGVAEEYLARLGYRVLACPDGTSALDAALAAGTIDLLVTDLIMPDMNGRELSARLGSRLKNMRVLYTSGYTADLISRHGLLEPGVEFLPKPYNLEELAWRVRGCLDREPR
ncbi:MAG: PAS domain S-box protein [Acidobacteria bacterium]|nr:PAS domain S-box protein [Acidobacteriota bacterium]